MTSNNVRILFIGAGRMARAIIAGLVRQKDSRVGEILVANRTNQKRLEELKHTFGIQIADDLEMAIEQSDVIILAIPPGEHPATLEKLSPRIKDQFIISVAAGIGIQALEAPLPTNPPVAWVMPNTAADIGQSISIFTCGEHVQPEHRELLEFILGSIGKYEEVSEQQVHALTAITGSAPAILYKIASIFEETAMSYGVTSEQARELVSQMIYGSASMMRLGEDPLVLAEQVTTPGGATAAGLQILSDANFEQVLQRSLEGINERARELNQK